MNTIRLQNKTWSLELAPDFGMNPISLRYKGEPVLREPESVIELCKTPLLYGIPVLFPANRTKDAKFTFDGVEYHLPLNEPDRFNNLHGCLYTTPFTVLEQTEDRVVSCLRNTRQCFPFPFTMRFTDTLTEQGFRREVELHNDGETPMPVTISFHSTFVEPDSFTVQVGQRFEFDQYYIPTWKMLPLNDVEQTFPTSCVPRGNVISAYYTSTGNVARIGRYRYTVENFDEWIFYNGNSYEGYLCVEPQHGMVNGFNRPDGHTRLDAGKSIRFALQIQLD